MENNMKNKIQAIKQYKRKNACTLLEACNAIKATGLFPQRINQAGNFTMIGYIATQVLADGTIITEDLSPKNDTEYNAINSKLEYAIWKLQRAYSQDISNLQQLSLREKRVASAYRAIDDAIEMISAFNEYR